MKLGERLRSYRLLKEMTQADLSKVTNIPQTTISDLERDKYIPNIDVLIKLTQALGVSLQELLENQSA